MQWSGAQRSFRGAVYSAPREPAVWKQTITWLLFWPLLCLIAQQAPLLSGPARTEAFYTQGAAAGDTSDYHLSLYILVSMQLVFFLSNAQKIIRQVRQNPVVLIQLVLVYASTIWSGNPGNTLRMGTELLLQTLFVTYLCVRFSTQRLMKLLVFMGTASALLSALFALALPSYGIFAGYGGGAWQGICAHKNTLGYSMAFLLTPVFFIDGMKRSRKIMYSILILFVIGMSQCRGAQLCTPAMLLFVAALRFHRRLKWRESVLFTILGLLGAGIVLAAFASSFGAIASVLGKDPSMSGRTDIFRLVWQAIQERPILGYGYGGFWSTAPQAERIGLMIGWKELGYSENGVLELGTQLGFVGVSLVVLMFAQAIRRGAKLIQPGRRNPSVEWFLTVLFLATLYNIDGGLLIAYYDLSWMFILIAYMGLARETLKYRAVDPLPSSLPENHEWQLQDQREEWAPAQYLLADRTNASPKAN
jgi:exopolysaccharide production protein ExoQ